MLHRKLINSTTVVVYAFSTPTLNFTANLSNEILIEVGNSYTLRWSAAAVNDCNASGSWSGSKGVNGTQTFTPTTPGNYTYSLNCPSFSGGTSGSVVVHINSCQSCLIGTGDGKETIPTASLLPTQVFVNTFSISVNRIPPGFEQGIDKGQYPLANVPVNPGAIQRVTYTLAGQSIAIHVTGDPISGNNGFFFILSDHLGSTSLLSTTGGSVVSGSTSRYMPFGAFRGTAPSQSITDRTYTGHEANNLGSGNTNLGLIYMNARYYLPNTNRFISADTLIPNPTNPQSYNRYSYIRNNPVNGIDPTGHREEDCVNGGCNIPPPPIPLIKFETTDDLEWTAEERATVLAGAWQVAQALFEAGGGQIASPREAFLAVYGGTVTFEKRNLTAGNLGETNAKNHVWVNIQSGGYGITHDGNGAMWAAHELGHAFNYALVPNTINDALRGQGFIDLAISNIRVDVNGDGVLDQIAGGSSIKTYDVEPTYTRTAHGYRPGKGPNGSYQQDIWPNAQEDFADMFSNYSFRSFDTDYAGMARYFWMDSHMSTWISLAVANNQ